MRFLIHRVSLIAILALTLQVGITSAQPGHPPPPPPSDGGQPQYQPPPPRARSAHHRRGLHVGVSIGLGEIIASDCDTCSTLTGLAFDFTLGAFIGPRIAIMYDAFGVFSYEDGISIANIVNSFAVQYWLRRNIWLKGGLGISQIQLTDGFFESYEFGVGGTAAVGFELMQRFNFVMDLQARLSHGTFDDGGLSNAAILLGFNWY